MPDAPKSLIGWATALQTMLELPVFMYAEFLRRRFDVRHLMLVSRTALLMRLLLALLVKPGRAWLVLPIQSLHGASFGELGPLRHTGAPHSVAHRHGVALL